MAMNELCRLEYFSFLKTTAVTRDIGRSGGTSQAISRTLAGDTTDFSLPSSGMP